MNTPIRMRNYGRILQDLIAHAVTLPEGEQRETLTQIIAKAMASRNLLWNSDQETSSTRILQDLESLSDGQLSMSAELLGENPIPAAAQKNTAKSKKRNRRR